MPNIRALAVSVSCRSSRPWSQSPDPDEQLQWRLAQQQQLQQPHFLHPAACSHSQADVESRLILPKTPRRRLMFGTVPTKCLV